MCPHFALRHLSFYRVTSLCVLACRVGRPSLALPWERFLTPSPVVLRFLSDLCVSSNVCPGGVVARRIVSGVRL